MIISYIFVIILVWWVIFFMILPFGIKIPTSQENKANATSAPVKSHLTLKLLATTILSIIITTIYMFLL